MKKILFVCTGNTCRSIMAQGIFNDMVEKDCELKNLFTSISAGIAVCHGDTANPNSIKVLQEEWNIDISSHVSIAVNSNHIRDSFLIFTMGQRHKLYLLQKYPEATNKIFVLKEFTANYIIDESIANYDYTLDINDPYGQSLEEYRRCAAEIRLHIVELVSILKSPDFFDIILPLL